MRLTVLPALALLAGCAGWEGPSHWLEPAYAPGRPASVCAASARPDMAHPVGHSFAAPDGGWRGSVRAQGAECIVHTDPLGASGAAWAECRVKGPALVTHAPSGGREAAYSAPAGWFALRATRSGVSCRALGKSGSSAPGRGSP